MRTAVLLRLALRSIGRNARRSTLTAAAMVVGLALLIFSRSLADGGHEQWIDSAVRMGVGHLALQAPGYLERADLEYRLDSARTARALALVDSILDSRVRAAAARLAVHGLASSATGAVPVRVEGVDPRLEAAFSDIDDKLVEGRYLREGDRLQAFVGRELARRLGLGVGRRFVVTAQTARGDVEGQLLRVAGIFETHVQEIDEGLIHIPLETARSWLGTPGAATSVAVLLGSSRETDDAVAALREALSEDAGVVVLGWREAAPELDSAVRIDDWGDYVFHTVLFTIVALAILNAMVMSVLGRRREFGILQALGLTPAETGWVVFLEGLALTAASGLVGMALGFAFTWTFFRDGLDFSAFMDTQMSFSGAVIDPVIIPEFRLQQVAVSVFFILIVGTLASIYPAVRASRIDVAEAMSFDR